LMIMGTQLMPMSALWATAPHCTEFWLLKWWSASHHLPKLITKKTYHETPPATAIGVQPVPMGTFRPEMSIPSRVKIRPLVTDDTELEFSTFWQH
jgi:hypothetical protein